jgi:putative SOS response-associated peptidase YedK
MSDGEPFAFAGLWERWRNAEGREVRSFSILTTAANELLSAVHTRMPVILAERDYDRWLDSKQTGEELDGLLRPYASDRMEYYAVDRFVNNSRNEGARCIERARFQEEDGLGLTTPAAPGPSPSDKSPAG